MSRFLINFVHSPRNVESTLKKQPAYTHKSVHVTEPFPTILAGPTLPISLQTVFPDKHIWQRVASTSDLPLKEIHHRRGWRTRRRFNRSPTTSPRRKSAHGRTNSRIASSKSSCAKRPRRRGKVQTLESTFHDDLSPDRWLDYVTLKCNPLFGRDPAFSQNFHALLYAGSRIILTFFKVFTQPSVSFMRDS